MIFNYVWILLLFIFTLGESIVRATESGHNTKIYVEQGGDKLTVESGAELVVNSGGTLTVNGTATIPTVGGTDLNAGASGTAGTVNVYPTTAAKGRIKISAGDSTGDTITTITNASQAGARTYTVPDAGASASFVMTEGSQTINGVQTYGSPNVYKTATSITAFAGGGQASGTLLAAEYNNVTTVASNFDSVRLPSLTVGGQKVTIRNSGAAILAVFPFSGDAIDSLSANLSVDIPVGGEATFVGINTTTWRTRETVNLHSPSTQKGNLIIRAADNAGNTQTLITNASQAAARTYTIPDAGANANFVLDAGTSAFTGRITTTDGVSSGTAKVVGGRAYANIAASDNVTAVASNNSHVDFANTYSIPASTLGSASVLKIQCSVRVTDASGTDTLEVKLYIGGTTLVTSTAFDPDAAGDHVNINFTTVSRAAAGASVDHVGQGQWTSLDGSTTAIGSVVLAPTNLATNGALIIKASAKWSSNTASTSARMEILNVEIY